MSADLANERGEDISVIMLLSSELGHLGRRRVSALLVILAGVLGLSIVLQATLGSSPTYHVNAVSGDDASDGLSPKTAWRSISRASAAVEPGDTVLIHSGRYRQPIKPQRSGTARKSITYRALSDATVIIEGAERLIDLQGKSYITIEGLIFRDPIVCWGEIRAGHHNELINNRFTGNGKGPRTAYSGLYLHHGASYNRIVGNVFQSWGAGQVGLEWGDALRLSNAPYNLIEANRFVNAGHALLAVDASFTIVRRNYFRNAWQKDIDLVWRVNPPWAPGQEFIARRNVVELNLIMRATGSPQSQHGGVGIQLAAAETIFRRNLLIENERSGMALNGWGDAPHAFGNRIYHNTFVGNGGAGVLVANWGIGSVDTSDNVIKNNVFDRNDWRDDGVQVQFDLRSEATDEAACFQNASLMAGNCFSEALTIDHRALAGIRSILYYQQHYPDVAEANRAAVPRFLNPTGGDFRLASGCGCIDAGVPLTTTRQGGWGTTVPLVDASYFTAGYGMVSGDRVKIGSNSAVSVIRVDDESDILTLAQAVRWKRGDPVVLGHFTGDGLDAGAFEVGDVAWPVRLWK